MIKIVSNQPRRRQTKNRKKAKSKQYLKFYGNCVFFIILKFLFKEKVNCSISGISMLCIKWWLVPVEHSILL